MKDSGVDWLGALPVGWNMKRGKYLFCESSRKGGSDLTLLSPTQAYGVVPQSQLEGVVRVKEDTDFNRFKTVVPDDFIISLRSFQGGFERSHISGVCSPAYTVFHAVTDEVWPSYFARLFKCGSFIEKMDNITRGIREGKNIGYSDFSDAFLPLPPLDEQQRIADYLDERCGEIDEVKQTLSDEIEALQRLRKATIHKAVTKGLDESAPMKDSGVEWIGEIPERWDTKRIKYFVESRVAGAWGELPELSEHKVICLRIADFDYDHLTFKNLRDDEFTLRGYKKSDVLKCRLKKGDILVEKSGGGEKPL